MNTIKKTIRNILAIAFILFMTGMLFLVQTKKQETEQERAKIENYISEDFFFLTDQRSAKKNNLLLFFSSTCSLCDYEAEKVIPEVDNFEDTNLIWVSVQPTDSIRVFAKRNKLNIEGVSLAQLPDSLYETKYSSVVPPQALLYSNDKLIKTFKGIVSPVIMQEEIAKQEGERNEQ